MIRKVTLAVFSQFSALGAQAGCNASFSHTIIDSTGQFIAYVPVDQSAPYDTAQIVLPTGQFFKASAAFSSCLGWGGKLWKDGVLVEEWMMGSVTWTSNEPGLYKWWVEGIGNMGMSLTRYFRVEASLLTSINTQPVAQGFDVRSLIVAFGDDHASVHCTSDRATQVIIESRSIDGRLLLSSSHSILPGDNRIMFQLPPRTGALSLVRFTTREGVAHTRKLVH